MSAREGKEGVLKIRDSAGYEWEDIRPPSPPSSENAHLIPPQTAETKQLCGYLNKASKGPIKTWRSRWFVFEDQRCCLFYYHNRSDFTPQGSIAINNAAFSYNVENLQKSQFEIRSEGRVHSLQASSKDTMFYWLNQLQTRRRRFSKRRKKEETHRDKAARVTFVSPDEEHEDLEEEEEEEQCLEEIVPLDIETPAEKITAPNSISRGKFSFKQQFSGLFKPQTGQTNQSGLTGQATGSSPGSHRKSNFYIEPPLSETNEENSTDPLSASFPSSPENPAPFVEQRPPLSLSRKLLRKVTRYSHIPSSADQPDCLRCQLLRDKLEEIELEYEVKKQEVKDRDEINEFLRNEIKMADMKAKVREELMTSTLKENKQVDILVQRDQTISELQRLMEGAMAEKERLTIELEAKKRELHALGEQVELFREAVSAKDHVVVELTNQLFQLENNGQVPNDPSEAMKPLTMQAMEEEMKKMKEAVEAYKKQNQFLSSELLEMNHLRSDDLSINKQLKNECNELEAKFIQQESKFLVLLRESQEARRGSDAGTTELLQQMMEEAIEQSDALSPRGKSSSFDVYGFSHTGRDTMEPYEDPLKVKVRKNEMQANRVQDDMDAQNKLQWEALWLQCVGTRHLQRSTPLKQMIRRGMPREYRKEMWKWMIKDTLKENYVQGKYNEIMLAHANQKSLAQNQIELDLHRTLPTHKYYSVADGEWIQKLRRVLVAFSWYDTSIGYCQGLNRLAAITLLFLDEEDSFWCLVAIIHHLLPRDYYDRSLLGSQTDQRVLKDILKERAPVLSTHLNSCDIDFSLITFNWFHTIFVDTMPSDTMIRIWDTFLYEGSKVLFRYAVAIFLHNQEALLAEKNSISIFNRLRGMCKEATDIKKLTEIAFQEITRFSMDTIRRKRELYRRQIQGEQDELERLRVMSTPQVVQVEEVESEEEICVP